MVAPDGLRLSAHPEEVTSSSRGDAVFNVKEGEIEGTDVRSHEHVSK
jgi:hypothetical protein